MANINEAEELKRLGMAGFISQYYLNAEPRSYQTIILRIKLEGLDVDIQYGIDQYQKGNFDEALIHFEQAIKLNPENFEALSRSGLVYIQLRKFDQGILKLQSSAVVNPEEAFIPYMIGRCFYFIHEYNEALNYFNEAISLKPNFSIAIAAIGDTN